MVHIDANTKAATILINTGIMAVFHSTKCQRWDYIIKKQRMQGNSAKSGTVRGMAVRNFFCRDCTEGAETGRQNKSG